MLRQRPVSPSVIREMIERSAAEAAEDFSNVETSLENFHNAIASGELRTRSAGPFLSADCEVQEPTQNMHLSAECRQAIWKLAMLQEPTFDEKMRLKKIVKMHNENFSAFMHESSARSPGEFANEAEIFVAIGQSCDIARMQEGIAQELEELARRWEVEFAPVTGFDRTFLRERCAAVEAMLAEIVEAQGVLEEDEMEDAIDLMDSELSALT